MYLDAPVTRTIGEVMFESEFQKRKSVSQKIQRQYLSERPWSPVWPSPDSPLFSPVLEQLPQPFHDVPFVGLAFMQPQKMTTRYVVKNRVRAYHLILLCR